MYRDSSLMMLGAWFLIVVVHGASQGAVVSEVLSWCRAVLEQGEVKDGWCDGVGWCLWEREAV